MLGTLAGRYRLDEVLGQGGMGVVYRATDLRLQRPVAVKTVSQAILETPEADVFVQQLCREAMLLAGLSHRNLAVVHDAFVHDGRPYFVMELVPGPTLEQAVPNSPLPTRRQWVEQLLDALEYLHAQAVAVRDLKPANAILAPDGTLKLVDFGIARPVNSAGATHPVLRGYGTEGYAPPEAYEGRPLDRASDLYSLGAVLAFVLTGSPDRLPDEAPAMAELIRHLTAARPQERPPLHEVRQRLHAAWPPGGQPSRLLWREQAQQTRQVPGPRWRDLQP